MHPIQPLEPCSSSRRRREPPSRFASLRLKNTERGRAKLLRDRARLSPDRVGYKNLRRLRPRDKVDGGNGPSEPAHFQGRPPPKSTVADGTSAPRFRAATPGFIVVLLRRFGIYFWSLNNVRLLVIVDLLGEAPLVTLFGLLLTFYVILFVRFRHFYQPTKAGE